MKWGWLTSLGISTAVSVAIVKNNGLFLKFDPEYLNTSVQPYRDYDFILHGLLFWFSFEHPETWDYSLHHFTNGLGIWWTYYNKKNFGYINNVLMYEMSTPWLSMYMLTKNPLFAVALVLTYTYYRIFNSYYMLFAFFRSVDWITGMCHVCNTLLNTYWYSKILRKCYVKLLQ